MARTKKICIMVNRAYNHLRNGAHFFYEPDSPQ